MYKVVKKIKLNETVELMVIEAPYVARSCMPGQFVIVIADGDGERIPLTIQDYDREKGTINIIYQVVGYSTRKISAVEEGEYLFAILGPLGQPVHFPENIKRVVGIGGGVGIAPLFPQMRYLKEEGAHVDVILGGRNKDFVILREQFEPEVDELIIATDDGSLGTKGFVTDVLKSRIESGIKYDLVIAIGPMPMMRAVVNITKPLGIPTNVSMNPIMIDGTGMCGGCRVTVDGQIKFACVDGPDFDGFQIDFDEAMRRQGIYKEEEHNCLIGKEVEK